MTRKLAFVAVMAFALVGECLLCGSAQAQPWRSRGDRSRDSSGGDQDSRGGGRDYRGGRGWSRDSERSRPDESSRDAPRGPAPPSRSRDYGPELVLRRMDENHDGVISPDEVPRQARLVIDQLARNAGLDPHRAMAIEPLVEAARKAREANAPSRGGDAPASSGGDSVETLLPGFGEEVNFPPVPGFGDGTAAVAMTTGSLEDRYEDRVLQYVNQIFEKYDKDKNGFIDAGDEMESVSWRSDPKESDLNSDGKLSKEEFCERIVKRWNGGRRQSPRSSSGTASTGSSGASAGPSSSSGSADYDRYRAYARSLINQYDTNKNGVLEKDEWEKMSGNQKNSDANGDDTITLDELTAGLANYAKTSSSSSGGDSSASSGSSGSSPSGRSNGWSGRHSSSGPSRDYRHTSSGDRSSGSQSTYRFKSPLERLPDGLPDWFARNDANGNGQVEMQEYSATWSNSKAAEFAKYDLNGDGVITPQECLDAEAAEDEKK